VSVEEARNLIAWDGKVTFIAGVAKVFQKKPGTSLHGVGKGFSAPFLCTLKLEVNFLPVRSGAGKLGALCYLN
jgi:hypothetical protein